MMLIVYAISAILRLGSGTERIRRRLTAITPQRICRANKDRLRKSSADKLGLTLGKDPDPLRPDRRAARELSSFRPASAKTMRCELTRTHLVAVTIKPGIIALTDALVRMTLTTICRPDLPILKVTLPPVSQAGSATRASAWSKRSVRPS